MGGNYSWCIMAMEASPVLVNLRAGSVPDGLVHASPACLFTDVEVCGGE